MNITQDQVFRVKQHLQEEMQEYEKKLLALVEKQKTLTKIEDIAQSVLDYNDLTNEIEDRSHVFALLSKPPEALRSPMVKSEFFSYIVAAETVGTDLVNFLIDSFLQQIRQDIQGGEDDTVDLIQAEYKEYIIPGKIIAERFDEIDSLLSEMNRFCTVVDESYTGEQARDVLRYAFKISITADTKMDPTIKALRELQFEYLLEEDRAELLDVVEEHLAVLRFDEAKSQTIAMDTAVKMLSEKEGKEQA